MVSDPPITVKLRLTEEELDMIHQKMIEIDFFNYPPVFCVHVPPGEPYGMCTPFTSYHFKVLSHGDVVKELWWSVGSAWSVGWRYWIVRTLFLASLATTVAILLIGLFLGPPMPQWSHS